MMDRRDEDGGKRFEDRRVKEKKPDVRTRAQTLSLKSLQPPILLLFEWRSHVMTNPQRSFSDAAQSLCLFWIIVLVFGLAAAVCFCFQQRSKCC